MGTLTASAGYGGGLGDLLANIRHKASSGLKEFEQAAAPAFQHLDRVLDGDVRKFIRPGGKINEEAKTTATLLIGVSKTLGLDLNEKNLEITGSRVTPKYVQEIKKFQAAFNEAIELYKSNPEALKGKNAALYEKIDSLVKADPEYATKGTSRWLDFRLTVDGVVGNWTGTVLKALSTDDGKQLLFDQNHINTLNMIAGGYWIGKTAETMPEAKRNRDLYALENRQYDENGEPIVGPYESYSPLNGYSSGRAVRFRVRPDQSRVNQNLIAALNQAASELGFNEIYVSTAISGHSTYTTSGHISRHTKGNAFDIRSIDGMPCNIESREGAAKADRLVAWLQAHGFMRSERGNSRAVLWRFNDRARGGNHNNHIHVSMND